MKVFVILAAILAIVEAEYYFLTGDHLTVHNLVQKYDTVVKEKNQDELAKLFDDAFVYFGCSKTILKHEAVKSALLLPSTVTYTLDLQSVLRVAPDVISYKLKINGLPVPIESVYQIRLSENGQYLFKSGEVISKCPTFLPK